MPDDVLRDLARAHGIDPAARFDRGSILEALVALPDSASLAAEADRRRFESRLERLRPRQLRGLGERHRVDLHGLKKKSELVEALARAADSSKILMELEAETIPEEDASAAFGKDSGLDFKRVEQLLDHVRRRFQERRYEAALSAAQEASRIAERTTAQLRRASWSSAILTAQRLLEPCDPVDAVPARTLLDRARDAFLRRSLGDDSVLSELVRAAEAAHAKESDRVRDLLAQTRDAIREVANVGAFVGPAEDAWKRGVDFLDRDQLVEARESFVEAAQSASDARDRRVREVEESLESVVGHIELARNVGADMAEADGLLAQARASTAEGQHGRAGDLLKRAERLAMKGQQRQIERAIQLRQSQVEKAQAIIAANEPVLKEAESYDLSVAEVRTLFRQARDVLAKGDYLAGLTFARNAEEAGRRLESQILEERRRRGISKPASGICGVCKSKQVLFEDDGWGRCADCGSAFRWRGPLGVWERLRSLLAS